MDELIARAQQMGGGSGVGGLDPSGLLLSAPEAERMVEQLREYPIEEVGTPAWMEQHDWIEKLNLQAHHNAQTHSDEFVMEAIVSFDKISTLVHELLAIEVWKGKVLPHLKKHLAKKVDSVTSYLLLYHEATAANLLEVTMFHSHAAEAVSEDAMLELVDWCYRKAIYLNNRAHEDANPTERTTQEWMEQSATEQLEDKMREIDFGVGMASLSILRYLTDHVKVLPLGVVNRMVNTCDVLMALTPLLENPPWVRRRKGETQKYLGNKWTTPERSERLKLTPLDAQVWLAINNLVVDPAFREKYDFTEFRKDALQSLRRYMNELLFDQLPVLKDLQRAVDELTLSSNGAASARTHLLMEAVPQMRDAMLSGKDWEAIAKRQKKSVFGEGARDTARKRMESMLKSFEFMAELEPGPKEAQPSKELDVTTLPVKMSTHRKTKQGVWAAFSDYAFSINNTKGSEPVELKDDNGNSVRGRRYRLSPFPAGTVKPLPARGKVSVLHGANTANALLELPAPSTKGSTVDFAAVVWLTIGLLATDGLALQIKLKKNPEISQRDAQDGEWYIYEPVGGAVTLLEEQAHLAKEPSTSAPTSAPPAAEKEPAQADKTARGVILNGGLVTPSPATTTSTAVADGGQQNAPLTDSGNPSAYSLDDLD